MTSNIQSLTSGTPCGKAQSYSNSIAQPVSEIALWSTFSLWRHSATLVLFY